MSLYPREVHGHEANPANETITINADEPGSGGASHSYLVTHPSPDGETSVLLAFQNGPVGPDGAGVNGITHEVLLATLDDRLSAFQTGPFSCPENEEALYHVRRAMQAMNMRTARRVERGVEGTHQP